MKLSKLKVLLTAVGCPGGVTMIRALKDNGEREIEIIGTDMRPEAGGRFFVDRFHTVASGHSPDFIPQLIDIVDLERPDVIFPQSSYEVYPLALHRSAFSVPIIAAGPRAIELSNDKGMMYEHLRDTAVPLPEAITCDSLDAFLIAAHSLGYPEHAVCFKPAVSKGSRGFRILSAATNRLDMLINRRVEDTTLTLEEAADILRDADPFPPLVVMEFAEGKEHTVDLFCQEDRVLMGFVKTREAIRGGIAMYFEIVDRPDLRRYGEIVAKQLGLEYFANIQFRGDKLLEVNPRVSTFVHQSDFNMPYLGLKYALGEIDAHGLRSAERQIRTTRRTVRYYDQAFYDIQDV